MNPHLQFDFIVDRESNSIKVIKEMAAGKSLVWDCYTKVELLEQWYAPEPLSIKTLRFEFREGGC